MGNIDLKVRGAALAGFLALALMVFAAPAGAVKPGTPTLTCADVPIAVSCDDELANLCAATENANSLKDRDQQTLISKIIGAAEKINQGKPMDADQKLADFERKIGELVNAPKPKISEDDADAIIFALIPAQMCVDRLVSE